MPCFFVVQFGCIADKAQDDEKLLCEENLLVVGLGEKAKGK